MGTLPEKSTCDNRRRKDGVCVHADLAHTALYHRPPYLI
ncbi:hypothetical protein DSBG_0903 [Desulfosporosinus sp. BG]|nr:hypothetical protein DSBG_0903 [Desulfosporosinus sp. BG]